MGEEYMHLLKKKSSTVIKKKIVQPPLEYERFIKIKCPYCSKGTDRKKHIYIDMPSEKLPDTARCPVCNSVLYLKDIYTKGHELKRR